MNKMIKAIIVEDEEEGRIMLKNMLTDFFDDVKVIGMAESALEGIKLIKNNTPDVVFLDIQMPHGTGFDVLEVFPEKAFEVVFTTAHTEYSIKAIQEAARDYIVKPIDLDDLKAAVERVRKSKRTKQIKSHKVAIPSWEGLDFINVNTIIRLFAEGGYTKVYFEDNSYKLASKNLKAIEKTLPTGTFLRVHNSHVVNVNFITRYLKQDGGILEMSDGIQIPISRRRKNSVLEALTF